MNPIDFITTLQHRTAVTAVGPSALRGQGKGVLKKVQEFLATIDLSQTPLSGTKLFREWLDAQTEFLLVTLSIKDNPWGTARK